MKNDVPGTGFDRFGVSRIFGGESTGKVGIDVTINLMGGVGFEFEAFIFRSLEVAKDAFDGNSMGVPRKNVKI